MFVCSVYFFTEIVLTDYCSLLVLRLHFISIYKANKLPKWLNTMRLAIKCEIINVQHDKWGFGQFKVNKQKQYC